MKKLFLTIACVVVAMGAFAQEQGWSWGGVKAGLNLSNISKIDDNRVKPSFYAGAFAEYRVNSIWGIQPEVVYSRQGAKYKSGVYKEYDRLNYLNIPIIFRIYVLDDLSVDLGLQAGILLHSKHKYRNEYSNNDATDTGKIDDTRGGDFSIAMGLSYTISRSFDIQARYNLGLTDVYKRHSGDNRNGVFQVGLGFRF